MLITALGVGSSAGTPMLGCCCDTCISNNPKNNRTRCSSLITLDNGQNILIDTGPDLRQQSLRENITKIDAVLYTHTHADHLHGIDDLRAFCQLQKTQIPLYGSHATIAHIADKFGYTLREPSDFWELPVLKTHTVENSFSLFNQIIAPIPIKHGYGDIFGYRIGNFAYLTDVSEIPVTSLRLLEGLDVLFLDCLRVKPHFTHVNLEQSLAYAGLIKANSTYLIHMTHELEYAALSAQLPAQIYVGYDGMKVNVI